ncbi:hypothetical protein Ga0123462_2060 [Mariprofundus ferrinatatus]|uniref:Uncharacterized protein n=1 Tax=Mariprofundus ferrinatatus TaxID=1921087 RepID=A0A2K8L6E4_9PROT|nr:hypothetical protein [Mariprofundus ferrinatatus]ATX82895.1 hypothetical protein Ga0123462_2060 [Mariprofundus ferrinatatus]
MKIHGTNPGRVNAAKVKKSDLKGSRFQDVLHTTIDGIHPETGGSHPDEQTKDSSNTLHLIEDAALILDQALEQIQSSGQPSEEIANSLNLLRDRLKQGLPDSDSLRDADAIIAVETSRLQSWKL